jgi:zinc and cadmium transporter
MNIFLQTLIASVLAGFLSVGIAYFFTTRLGAVWLTRLVSFSAGLMLSLALLDLLPEALADGMSTHELFLVILVALLALFAIDFKLNINCQHDGSAAHALTRPIPMVLAGGALHVFSDGLLVGAAFLADPVVGWGMTLAILAHEVPREAGDFALLLIAKWSRARALLWITLSRLACVLGAVTGYLALSGMMAWLPFVLTVAAANFIYIALTGLIPWLRQGNDKLLWQGAFMITGAAMVPLFSAFLN